MKPHEISTAIARMKASAASSKVDGFMALLFVINQHQLVPSAFRSAAAVWIQENRDGFSIILPGSGGVPRQFGHVVMRPHLKDMKRAREFVTGLATISGAPSRLLFPLLTVPTVGSGPALSGPSLMPITVRHRV